MVVVLDTLEVPMLGNAAGHGSTLHSDVSPGLEQLVTAVLLSNSSKGISFHQNADRQEKHCFSELAPPQPPFPHTSRVQMCSEHCGGAAFMATQYGDECWCSEDEDLDYGRHKPSGDCNMPCFGDSVSLENNCNSSVENNVWNKAALALIITGVTFNYDTDHGTQHKLESLLPCVSLAAVSKLF